MWVVCCGMMRSGSTLQYNIAGELVRRLGVGEVVGFLDAPVTEHALLNLPQQRPDRRYVYKVHDYSASIVGAREQAQLRLIYCYRDLRDVLASWMQMQSLPYEEVNAQAFLSHQVANMTAWMAQPDCLVQQYERNLVGDLEPAVRAIAAHMDLPLDAKTCRQISDQFALQAQKARIEAFDYKSHGLRASGLATTIHPDTLLHDRHILSGRHGRWHGVLSLEQLVEVEGWFSDWLQQYGYESYASAARPATLVQWLRQRFQRLLPFQTT